MKRKYSVIVSDLGNVLIPFNYNLTVERLEKVEKGLGKYFMNYYKNNYEIHRKFGRGEISGDEFVNKMLNVLDHKVDAETFCEAYSKIFTVNKEVVDLLPKLKEKYTLVLLSNTDPVHRKYGWQDYEFINYFDKLILSYEIGSVKPEEKIYKAAEEFTQKPPAEHLFIDDIKEYAEAAKNLGWDAIHFTDYENLYDELKKREIL